MELLFKENSVITKGLVEVFVILLFLSVLELSESDGIVAD